MSTLFDVWNTIQTEPKPKGKRGRPRKGEFAAPKPCKRVELQAERTLEENLNDLPTGCIKPAIKYNNLFFVKPPIGVP